MNHTIAAVAKKSSKRNPRIPPTYNRANNRTVRKNIPIPYSANVSAFKFPMINAFKGSVCNPLTQQRALIVEGT